VAPEPDWTLWGRDNSGLFPESNTMPWSSNLYPSHYTDCCITTSRR
jgi:hypothetical protein